MSISNCCFLTCIQISQLTQVEGKNRLRNGTLILQLVKDGDDSSEGYVGVVQAQDAIKRYTFKPGFRQA